LFGPTVRGSTQHTAIGWPPTTTRAAVGLSAIVFDDALTAGFDFKLEPVPAVHSAPPCRTQLPSHASNRLPAHKGRAQVAINNIAKCSATNQHACVRPAGDAERLLTAATSAQEAAQLARLRFDSGVTDFLIVLDAECEVLNNSDHLAQAQTDTATALVSVCRALGGRWAAAGRAVCAVTLMPPGNSSRQPVCCARCSTSCSRIHIESGFSGPFKAACGHS
jgi:hypothetical protein